MLPIIQFPSLPKKLRTVLSLYLYFTMDIIYLINRGPAERDIIMMMAKHINLFVKIKRNISSYIGIWIQKNPTERAIIKWRAPEFYLVDKGVVWGVLLALFFVALAGLFVYFGQILLGVITVLFMFVLLKFAYAKPETLEYRVEDLGVRISGWLHPYYDDIISFWIGRQGNQQTLYLQTRNMFTDHLSIPIKDISTKKLSRALEKYLPERLPPQTPKVPRTKKK